MKRLVAAAVLLSLVAGSSGCRDAGNSPRATYDRLRQAILEEDLDALSSVIHPRIRAAYRTRVVRERARIAADPDPRVRTAYARSLRAASFADVERMTEDRLVLADLGSRLGNALRRDWVERSAIDETWNDGCRRIDAGIQIAGPDRALIQVRTETGGVHRYRFGLAGGRWWWRPDLPVFESP